VFKHILEIRSPITIVINFVTVHFEASDHTFIFSLFSLQKNPRDRPSARDLIVCIILTIWVNHVQ